MPHFDKKFIEFFQDLTKNNNRDWFLANKKSYEQSVRQPFLSFVQELIDQISDAEGPLPIEAKDVIFRLNRDIRFSKDKTPYKTHMAALVSAGGKKDKTTPGLYLQASAEDLRIYSGAHMLEKEQLQRVRSYIASHLTQFEKLISDKSFKGRFGQILGEKNKRLPPEFAELEPKQPLIANKSFYFFAKFPPKTLLKPDLTKTVMDYYTSCKPVRDFFSKALSG